MNHREQGNMGTIGDDRGREKLLDAYWIMGSIVALLLAQPDLVEGH